MIGRMAVKSLVALFLAPVMSASALFALTGSEQTMRKDNQMSDGRAAIYDVDFQSIRGDALPFSDFAGLVVLVVNTASQCGCTGQYAGLQELHDTFSADGFRVLGVPSNDFGGQESGSEEQIARFCQMNYGVTFPLTAKVHASGPGRHQFWKVAEAELGEKAHPKWNFHKVLVGRDGRILQAYPSGVRPNDVGLVADIEAALG